MPLDPDEPIAETKVTVAALPPRKDGARRRRPGPSELARKLELGPGDRIGRYVVIEPIAAGGMGLVLKAADPELDRLVAIKLLRPGDDATSTQGRARLIREGQAIAQLAHPNVVTVHDSGVFRDDLVFVAMEYVEGRSLRTWLAEAPRSRREIVEVFVQAGKGLAAAHAKGLVHRDFKPDNVLVGDDGRVRVADFGLARSQHDVTQPREPASDSPDDAPTGWTSSLDSPLTRTGHVMGTPAYMAPEQHRGERSDARSDQFAFCVALYQALCKAHPFQGVPRSATTGEPLDEARPPTASSAPGWLERLLRRGLALDPARRFDSMDALLAELQRDRGTARRMALIAGAVLVSLAVGAAVTRMSTEDARMCQGADDLFDEVWNDRARVRVRAAFLATGRPYAEQSFARIDAAFDDFGARWMEMSTASCQATQVHGVQSEHVLDLRTRCLARRLSELGALVGVLSSELDATQLDQAVQAASGLAPLDACASEAALAAVVPPPADPDVRRQVDELQARLDQARALQSTGAYVAAMAIAEELARDAAAIDYPPLQAETQLTLGALQQKNGDPKTAEATLHRALAAAAAARDTQTVAEILSELVWVVGYQQARYDEGVAYFHAASAAVTLADGDVILRAQLLKNVGGVRLDQGRYDEARRYYEEGSAAVEQAFGPEHPYLATALNNVGTVLFSQGAAADALPYFQRALAIDEQALGAEHPRVADHMMNIGAALGDQGKYDEARTYLLRAVAALDQTLGADHLDLAYPLFNIGNGYANQDHCAEAIPYYQRALAIREAALGKIHPHVAYPLTGLGVCALSLGKPAEAIAPLERAAQILAASGSDPNPLAAARFSLARALWDSRADRPRALELASDARRAWAASTERWDEELHEVEAWLRERDHR